MPTCIHCQMYHWEHQNFFAICPSNSHKDKRTKLEGCHQHHALCNSIETICRLNVPPWTTFSVMAFHDLLKHTCLHLLPFDPHQCIFLDWNISSLNIGLCAISMYIYTGSNYYRFFVLNTNEHKSLKLNSLMMLTNTVASKSKYHYTKWDTTT